MHFASSRYPAFNGLGGWKDYSPFKGGKGFKSADEDEAVTLQATWGML